jgi:formylmethanofuran dehydrogenase subunit E
MGKDKYVKWKHVEELLALIKKRDSFYDWSDNYEKYNKKVKNTIEWLDRNAEVIEPDREDQQTTDEDHELIECSECGEEKAVEKGTYALEKGMCEQCYCFWQGG